jgi:hypothetical protein
VSLQSENLSLQSKNTTKNASSGQKMTEKSTPSKPRGKSLLFSAACLALNFYTEAVYAG